MSYSACKIGPSISDVIIALAGRPTGLRAGREFLSFCPWFTGKRVICVAAKIGTKYPILIAKQDQLHSTGFSDVGQERLIRVGVTWAVRLLP
jgi:hypothetical protein